MRKILLIPVVIVIVAVVAFIFMGSSDDPMNNEVQNNTQPESSQSSDTEETGDANKTTIRIAAMGDMLPHDTVNLRAQTGDTYNYVQFLDRVQPHIADADIVFCNQESPSAGQSFGISGYPSFNAPTEFATDLNSFGCNVINLANNHIADKGQAAIDATLASWDSLNTLAVSGANRNATEQSTISYFDVEGKTFAFVAFTDLSNNSSVASFSVNMFSEQLVSSLVSEAKANADYVIASAHWGIEDSSVVSDSQRAWATLMADNGVDLIIGTGPHVIQPVENIGDTIVFYSLGNFLSTQLTIEQLTGGVAFIDIPLDGEGGPKLSFLPTYMSYTWSASEAATEDLLARDNLEVVPLDEAGALIDASLFNTTAPEQRARIESLLNQSTTVEILSSN